MKREKLAPENTDPADLQLCDGVELLKRLFSDESRPTHRWLQMLVERGVISSTKIGRLRFYCPAQVKRELAQRNTIQAKAA